MESEVWRGSKKYVELQVCGLARKSGEETPPTEVGVCASLTINCLKSRVVRLGTRLDDFLRRLW